MAATECVENLITGIIISLNVETPLLFI